MAGVDLTDGYTLQYHMNRKAGTLFQNVPTMDAQGAANVWAGTVGLDLVGALNVKAGNTPARLTNVVTNPSFEVDTAGWAVESNCSFARSTAQSAVGVASLAVTFTTAASGGVQTTGGTGAFPVSPGTAYTAQARFRAAVTGRTCTLYINWADAAGAWISNASGVVADTTTGWSTASVTATAPANAAYAYLAAWVTAPAASEVHYLDAVMLEPGSTASSYSDASMGYRELVGVLNQLAGTTALALDQDGAAASIP